MRTSQASSAFITFYGIAVSSPTASTILTF